MTHHKASTGSKNTMRRTLMGGAVVSSLLIASLAPASAGCLSYGNLQYNPQYTYQQSPPQTQATPNQNSGFSIRRASLGTQLRWTPRIDAESGIKMQLQYGRNKSRDTFAGTNRHGNIAPTAEEFRRRPNINAPAQPQGYVNRFGGVRISGASSNQNLQWGQGLNNIQPNLNTSNQVARVNVNGYVPNRLSQIPNLNGRLGRPAEKSGIQRGDVLIYVTPSFRPINER